MLLPQLFLELSHMPPCGQQFGNSDPKIQNTQDEPMLFNKYAEMPTFAPEKSRQLEVGQNLPTPTPKPCNRDART